MLKPTQKNKLELNTKMLNARIDELLINYFKGWDERLVNETIRIDGLYFMREDEGRGRYRYERRERDNAQRTQLTYQGLSIARASLAPLSLALNVYEQIPVLAPVTDHIRSTMKHYFPHITITDVPSVHYDPGYTDAVEKAILNGIRPATLPRDEAPETVPLTATQIRYYDYLVRIGVSPEAAMTAVRSGYVAPDISTYSSGGLTDLDGASYEALAMRPPVVWSYSSPVRPSMFYQEYTAEPSDE